MKNKDIFVSKLLFFTMIGSIGSFASFINLHLEQVVGLSASQIGFITFLGLITTVVATPFWGYLSDKTGKHVALLKLLFLAVSGAGAIYYASRTFALAIVGVILLESFRSSTNPLLDYIATNYCAKYHYDFGKIRVAGSLGYLLIAMLTGFLVSGVDFNFFGVPVVLSGFMSISFAAFGVFIILNLLSLLLMFLLPTDTASTKKEMGSPTARFDRSDVVGLLKNKPFIFILVLTMLGYMTVEAAFSFSTMHLVTILQARESIISWLAFFQVVPELLLLTFGSVFIKKMGVKNWYIFTMVTMCIRLTIYSFATNPMLFVVGGTFHGIMMAMHIVGNISYIRKVVDAKVTALAFTILASTMALSRGLLTVLFGFIYENIDSFMVFRVSLGIVLVALMITIFSKNLKIVGADLLN